MINKIELPVPEINLSLKQFVQLECNILDISIKHGKKESAGKRGHIEAASTLFDLYSEFKNSHHFGRKTG